MRIIERYSFQGAEMNVCFLSMMKPINSNGEHPRHMIAPLDIGYCAALLERKGHAVSFIDYLKDCKSIDDLAASIRQAEPDIIVIKPGLGVEKETLEIASLFDKHSSRIFLIGPVAFLYPHLFLRRSSRIEFIIEGEPELTLLDLVGHAVKNHLMDNRNVGYDGDFKNVRNIKGIIFYDRQAGRIVHTQPRGLIKDLDSLPFPKHDFFLDKRYDFFYPFNINRKMKLAYVLASRGCPYNCLFCSPIERASVGKSYRSRTPKSIVDEMEWLQGKGVNSVYFPDDILFVSDVQIKALCLEMIKRKIKIKWAAQVRINLLTEPTIRLMKKAGCSTLCMGVESGSPRILKILSKGVSIPQIKQVFMWLRSAGILSVAFVVFGNPKESEDDLKATARLVRGIKPDFIQVHFFTQYPGSPQLEKERADEHDSECAQSKFRQGMNLSNVSDEQLRFWQKKIYVSFYLSPSFIFNYFIKRSLHIFLNLKMHIRLTFVALRFLI